MSGFSVKMLSDSEVEQIHETSLRVLEEIGVDVQHDRIRASLLTAGAREGETNTRVRLPRQLVMEAVRSCPRDIVLDSVRGEKYKLTADSRFYSSCCVDPFIGDYHDGLRPPRIEDCAGNARLIDALDMISMPYKMDVAFSDVSDEETALLESNLAFMSNMSKHYVCGPHSVMAARTWMEMSEIMAAAGSSKEKIVSALVSPISPLTLDKQFLDIVEFLLPYQIMLILLPCPQAGATSPFSIAGTVVTCNVEQLATITAIQTLQPGSPIFCHSASMGFNMKSSLASLGGPEKLLCAVANADMGRFYNLPCGSAGAASDSVRYDIQTGAETMSQLQLSVCGQANVVFGIGSFCNGMGTSAEKILFDCELVEMAEYLRKGIQVDDVRMAFEAIQRVGPGGDFLMDEHTLHLLHSEEHFYAGSFERSGSQEEKSSMYENLHKRVVEILSNHKPNIPENRLTALREYVREKKAGN